MVPALAIELALDHKPSHREMTSRLISVLYLKVLPLACPVLDDLSDFSLSESYILDFR